MPEPDKPALTLLALDYGQRRIGIATGSSLTGAATPLTTLTAPSAGPDWHGLDRVVAEWQPDLLVVGLPFNQDGSESAMTATVRHFAAELKQRYKLRIELVDERYTSVEAEAHLREERRRGIRSKKLTKQDVDAKAAQLIAESWMRKTG